MNKSTIVKWAVAALLAVPAMPLLGSTAAPRSKKPLIGAVHTTRKLSTSSRGTSKLTATARHRQLHHTNKRTTPLLTAKRGVHPMISSRKPTVHTAARTGSALHGTIASRTASKLHTPAPPARCTPPPKRDR